MNRTLRALTAGTFLAALAGAGLTAYPALAADAGMDFWELPALNRRLSECERNEVKMGRQMDVVMRREAVRAEVVVGILAGWVRAEDGAQTFLELNRSDANALEWAQMLYPAGTDEGRAAQQLVAQIRAYPHPRAAAVAGESARRLGVAPPH